MSEHKYQYQRQDLFRQMYVASFNKRQDHYYAKSDAIQAIEAFDEFFEVKLPDEVIKDTISHHDDSDEIPF